MIFFVLLVSISATDILAGLEPPPIPPDILLCPPAILPEFKDLDINITTEIDGQQALVNWQDVYREVSSCSKDDSPWGKFIDQMMIHSLSSAQEITSSISDPNSRTEGPITNTNTVTFSTVVGWSSQPIVPSRPISSVSIVSVPLSNLSSWTSEVFASSSLVTEAPVETSMSDTHSPQYTGSVNTSVSLTQDSTTGSSVGNADPNLGESKPMASNSTNWHYILVFSMVAVLVVAIVICVIVAFIKLYRPERQTKPGTKGSYEINYLHNKSVQGVAYIKKTDSNKNNLNTAVAMTEMSGNGVTIGQCPVLSGQRIDIFSNVSEKKIKRKKYSKKEKKRLLMEKKRSETKDELFAEKNVIKVVTPRPLPKIGRVSSP